MRPTTLLLPILALCSVPLHAQGNLKEEVRVILTAADSGSLDGVWDYALELSDLDAPEEALAEAIEGAVGDFGANGRLTAALGLHDLGGNLFAATVFEILEPVAKDGSGDERRAAFSILGKDDLGGDRRISSDVRGLLDEATTSELNEPLVRVEAARSLWQVGNPEHRANARRTLRSFLRSSDKGLRVESALSLAEMQIDSSDEAWAVLREIALQPTPQGRLAQSYIQREERARLHERRLQNLYAKIDEAQSGNGSQEFALLQELMVQVNALHIRGEEFDQDYFLEMAAKGLIGSLDRHSSFLSSEEFQRFYFDLDRNYAGIGAFVNFDAEGFFSIVRPIYSGPAYRMGLRSGDRILEVDGWETAGHTSDEIISRLKGKPETDVVVQIARPGLVEPQDVAINREEIQVPSVNYQMMPGNVGYLELITFGSNSGAEMRAAIEALRADGAESLVLDVRNNTGGFITAAQEVVELFVPGEKLVVYTKGRLPDDRQEYLTRDVAMAAEMPLAVLINDFSASASEITAGALQDHGRAVLVGERSFGKGSVQSLLPLRSSPGERFADENNNRQFDEWERYDDRNGNGKFDVGAHVKLTVARYHLPSGRNIHKEIDKDGQIINPDWGVMPDREIELREIKVGDAWKNAEILDLFQTGAFRTYVDERVEDYEELFLELAETDKGSTERYPDFDSYYEGLETNLPKDDVRRWIRYQIRDAVADIRGKAYPGGRTIGDFQEDTQLQEAMRVVLEKQGKDIRELDLLRPVLKLKLDGTKKAAKNG